jgi:hypothetical protein
MDKYEQKLIIDALRSNRPTQERITGFNINGRYFATRTELADAIEKDDREVLGVLSIAARKVRVTLAEQVRTSHVRYSSTAAVVHAAIERKYLESGVPGFISELRRHVDRANLCLNNGMSQTEALEKHLLGSQRSSYHEPTIQGLYLDTLCKSFGIKDPTPPKRDRY